MAKTLSRKSILIYCEGENEVECANYISSFGERKRNKKVWIKDGHGGSPLETVKQAIKISGMNYYDEKYVWIDTDREELERAIVLAKKHKIGVLTNDTVLESEIFRVLGIKMKKSISPKKQYESHFPGKPLNQRATYQGLFPTIKHLNKKGTIYANLCEIIL